MAHEVATIALGFMLVLSLSQGKIFLIPLNHDTLRRNLLSFSLVKVKS